MPSRVKSGTPPWVLALLIILPLVGIIYLLTERVMRQRSPDSSSAVTAKDPNVEINKLIERFTTLDRETRKTLAADRESSQFESKVEALKRTWEVWMEDFDRIFAPLKNPDGTLSDEYAGYSDYKRQAGLRRIDLIKVGGF